jgi:hypothetical protein
MKIRKDLIIAVMVTFCLTATLFMILPTSSNPGSEYDPWIDNNEDGEIDIFDAISWAHTFATSGDPTKNVNVMNWPVTNQQTVFWNATSNATSTLYNATGFGHMHLTWWISGLLESESVTLRIWARIYNPVGGSQDFMVESMDINPFNYMGALTYPVLSEMFHFTIEFASGTTASARALFFFFHFHLAVQLCLMSFRAHIFTRARFWDKTFGDCDHQ